MESVVDTGDLPALKNLLGLKKKYDAPDPKDLPKSYKINSEKERLYLWAAQNFEQQIRHKYPWLKPLCLTCQNECGTEKLVMTFIKPSVLPYSHLFDLDQCSNFISDYLFYQSRPFKGMLWSPTHVLATQIGSSLDMSNVLASFLIGFGYQAFVVCGWVDKATSKMDRTKEHCDLLEAKDLSEQADEEKRENKYTPKKPPELKSKYLDFLKELQEKEALRRATATGKTGTGKDEDESSKSRSKKKESSQETEYFHAWIYVDLSHIGSDGEGRSFFIEATTGMRKSLSDPSYRRINSVWNHENYWLSKTGQDASTTSETLKSNDKEKEMDSENGGEGLQRQETTTSFVLPTWNWKEQKSLELGNEEHWIKFVCDVEQTEPTTSDQSKNSPKRLLTNLDSWLDVLDVPRDSFELMYRLGQRVSEFHKIKVENFAPYLLKDGMNQRVTQFQQENWYKTKSQKPKAVHILERFRYRMDKMNARETFPDDGKIVERFGAGRKDRLKQRDFFTLGSSKQEKTEDISTFFHTSRTDGLSKRIVRSDDMELTEVYVGREDGLVSMQVTFGVAKKEFGPAEGKGSAREVAKIIERFADKDFTSDAVDGPGGDDEDLGDPDDLDSDYTPGRVLDTRRVLERIFDLDSDRILIKFHREGGQIFCKTAEFLAPHQQTVATTDKEKPAGGKEADIDTNDIPNLSEQDVKVYLVNPRDKKPTLLELSDIYREQVVLQKAAVKRVAIIQKEMHKLLEDRMKELSAHDMEVWIFDTKRNPQVTRGRQEQEQAARKREEDVMDLELDFLAPYLERFPDVSSLSKFQALEVRDECLSNVRSQMEFKEQELKEQMESIKEELKTKKLVMTPEDIRSKKFLLNVVTNRLERQKVQGRKFYAMAEQKIKNDTRLGKFMS